MDKKMLNTRKKSAAMMPYDFFLNISDKTTNETKYSWKSAE